MQLSTLVLALASLAPSVLAKCGDPDTIPGPEVAVRIYYEPDCAGGAPYDLPASTVLGRCVDGLQNPQNDFDLESALSAITPEGVQCNFWNNPNCDGQPEQAPVITSAGNPELYQVPIDEKNSYLCYRL
jgi:hypothetical protein